MAPEFRALAAWEVEEFIEQAALRKPLWLGKDKLWVRKRDGENQFALKFVNGLPDNMYTLYVKRLTEELTDNEVERHVSWLLAKLTSYRWRKRVEEFLRAEIPQLDEDRVRRLALAITNPDSISEPMAVCRTIDELTHSPVLNEPAAPSPVEVEHEVLSAERTAGRVIVSSSPVVTPPPPKRSKYLERLLGKG